MNIIEFKKSNLFEKYENWISSIIANDYYYPGCYNEDGDEIGEPSFDDEAFEKEEEEILDSSLRVYEEIAHGRIRQSKEPDRIVSDEECSTILLNLLHNYGNTHNYTVLLGTIYFLFVYDYPNYKVSCLHRTIMMRFYRELFTHVAVNINAISEWLDLYASLRGLTSVLALPEELQNETAQKYFRRLKDAEFLDDNYKFAHRVKSAAWKHLIARELKLKIQCTWDVLQDHFNVSNLRDDRTLQTFLNKRTSERNERDQDIYDRINDCFRRP